MSTPTPEELTAAANLLRSAGYAIVTKTECESWQRWLDESHKRERAQHDAETNLVHHYTWLLDRVTDMLAPSRPRWLRDERRWWTRGGWSDPIVFNLPVRPGEEKVS